MDFYTDYDAAAGIFGGLAIFFIILIVLLLAFGIVAIIANWKLFKKAGKGGWECIIPFYGQWVLVEIAELHWWWFLIMIANSIVQILDIEEISYITNLASLFASFNCYFNIAKKFNKTTGTAVCAGLFSGIFVLIFGFSKNEVFNKNIPVSKNGCIGTPEELVNTNSNSNYQKSIQQSTPVMENNINNNVQPHVQEFSFCGNCGTKLDKDAKFCPNCGKQNS